MIAKKIDPYFAELWRCFPHTFAQKMSKGSWLPFNYLKWISQEIAKCVIQGNGRLIVELPARHGKSTLISHWVPFWFLSLHPNKNVILSTYEADFAASWGRRVRNEIQNNPLSSIRVTDDSSAAHRWQTTEGGGMITAGIGGPITGRGGNLIIVDDPVKNAEEASSQTYRDRTIDWFNSTLYTRAEPGATIVVLMTRWHQQDLAGYLESERKEAWKVFRLPAIAEENDPLGRELGQPLCPERYDLEALERIKRDVGSRVWNSMYQQRPSAELGELIQRSWFKFYTTPPEKFEEIIQSWDMAFKESSKSDFVVGQVWGRVGANKYLIDQIRKRMDFPSTIEAVRRLTSKHPKARLKLIEEKANGAAVIASLTREIPGLVPFNPSGNKMSRLNAVSPDIEAGNVYLPLPQLNPWVSEFIDEVVQFPNGAHDDQVDAMSQALLRLQQLTGAARIKAMCTW
jgi:predicted phage terminase large subunit-like protein